jgi:hypothetical protein
MRRRRRSDEFAETVIVHTEDGKTFRCSIATTGRETEPRWVLMDEDARQYVGPAIELDHTPEAVRRQVAEWWAARKNAAASTDRKKRGKKSEGKKESAPSK